MPLSRRLWAVLAALTVVLAAAGCAPRHQAFCFGEGGQIDGCVSTAHRGSAP
jgi:hypothetical protein